MARRLAVIGLLVLCGGLASPARADLIYGCQNNANGKIAKLGTVIPKCGKKQSMISWDTSPPQPQPQPQLPPKLFTDGMPAASDQLLCDQTVCETTLVTLTADPGTYLLVASLSLAGDGNLAFCYLHQGTQLIPNVTPPPFTSAAAQPQLGGYVPMALQAAVQSGVPAQYSLTCAANGTHTHAQNWTISAIEVREMN